MRARIWSRASRMRVRLGVSSCILAEMITGVQRDGKRIARCKGSGRADRIGHEFHARKETGHAKIRDRTKSEGCGEDERDGYEGGGAEVVRCAARDGAGDSVAAQLCDG